MDDSDKPTLETEGLEKPQEWSMPEPVFRSTPGKSLRGSSDPEHDIPTEPANKSEQSVRIKETPMRRHQKKKKGGCARFFTLLALVIGLVVGALVVGAIYFLFYYRTPSTTF